MFLECSKCVVNEKLRLWLNDNAMFYETLIAASSKAIQVTEVGGRLECRVMLSSKRLLVREALFPVTRSVYLLASSQTCCSLKD